MREKLISIVIPVYNASKYIHKSVDSVLNQSYRNLEVLLVDDGSTDESGRICDEYGKADSRVKVIHKENGGLVSAWKAGAEASTGDYLSFVDSDDWIDENMMEEMVAQTSDEEKEIISSDYVIERLSGDSFKSEYVYQALKPGEYLKTRPDDEIVSNLLGHENRFVTISRCMKLISRCLITENMHYSLEKIRMGEDMSITLPALIDARRLVIMDHKAYYHYLYVEESMVHKYDSTMYESLQLLMETVDRIITDKNIPALREPAQKERILLLLLSVKNEARGNKKGCRENIRKIHSENEELIKNTKVEINSLSNKLVYRALAKPNWFNLTVLRLAMIVYYR